MSYTPTPQYSFPASSYPPSATATPPLPPPKPLAPQHVRAASASINHTATPPPPPPPPRPDSRALTDSQNGGHGEHRPESSYTMAGASEAVGGVHAQFNQYQSQQQQQQAADGWLPQILLDKSKPDLTALLTNPELLTALLHAPSTTHPSLPASQQPLQHALATNTALATSLLPLLSHLLALRASVSTHLLSVRALEQSWRRKQADLEAKLEPWGPRELHARLVASIQEQESVCRGVEESWLEEDGVAGEREVGEWVRRVREGRALVALRRERRARWDEGRVGGWR